MGRDLAKKLGVIPTPPEGDSSIMDYAKAVAMLQSKRGAEFDRAYLQHEVSFHQAVIDAIKGTLLPAAAQSGAANADDDSASGVRAPSRGDEGRRREDGREVSREEPWPLRSLHASIHDVGAFLDLSDRSQRLLAGGLRYAHYGKGASILAKGQRVSGAYVVVSGQLRVFTLNARRPGGHAVPH